MGSHVQEIFQGRGDKEGKGFRIKKGFALFFIALSFVGLVTDFAFTGPLLWFSLCGVTIAICSAFHFLARRAAFSAEFLFSFALPVAGLVRISHLPWLKVLFFPLAVSMSAFYGTATVVPLSLLIPLLWLRPVALKTDPSAEISFVLAFVLTSFAAALLFGRLKRQRESAVSSLDSIRNDARSITLETGIESLRSEEITSHYFASILRTDEEIRELLFTVKSAVFADSANLFVPEDSSYRLRISTEEKGEIIITGKGAVLSCFADRRPFSSGDAGGDGIDPGYIKSSKVSSLVAVPLMAGPSVAGVLSVDSARFQAFNETEKNTVALFSNHLVRVLERERVYMMIKRQVFGLQVLMDESGNLVSSLNTEVIAAKLAEAAAKIAPSRVYLFVSEGRKFRLAYHSAPVESDKKIFDLAGTFVNMAVENGQQLYVSDVTGYKMPMLPFRSAGVKAAFAVPMTYERGVLGLFVMLSERRDFLDIFQTDLVKVMCYQASMSIANARLHGEIEKMATTDGLTGLLNHRVFQERLSSELKRLNRFSGPLSLLLCDIDYFKKVNDNYGHPVGDLVLKGVSKLIRETVRDVDIAARYGGEEFAVILPGTDSAGAQNFAERLRKKVSEKTFSADGKTLNVTISLGMATSPSDAARKEELVEKADQALYHAKHNGRNRSVIWSGTK